jgi:hypothetical protein
MHFAQNRVVPINFNLCMYVCIFWGQTISIQCMNLSNVQLKRIGRPVNPAGPITLVFWLRQWRRSVNEDYGAGRPHLH